MNLVQIGERLRDLPISILSSNDIIAILKHANGQLPEDQHISASSTGNDIYRLFCDSPAEIQTELLKDIFSARRETLILNTIFEESSKQLKKDSSTNHKWTSIHGSVLLLGAGFLIAIVWSFISSYGLKPAVPEAVVGNLVTDMIKMGGQMLIDYLSQEKPNP